MTFFQTFILPVPAVVSKPGRDVTPRCAARSYTVSRSIALGLLVFFGNFTSEAAKTSPIWIDTDASIGAPWREVDDAFALILAFHSSEVRIVGISTTYGNASVGYTTKVARDLVRDFGAPAGLAPEDVFPGTDSPRDVGRRTSASEALARRLQEMAITYVALGPLTNLAGFLQLHRGCAARIENIILVAGRSPGERLGFGPDDRWRIHDANVFKDPAAVRVVLESGIPVTLAPVETASRLMLNEQDLRRIRRSPLGGEFLYQRTRLWAWFWTTILRERGGPAFDVLAMLCATRPDLVRTERRHARLDQAGNLIASRQFTTAARAVLFCTAVRAEAKEFTLQRLQGSPAEL